MASYSADMIYLVIAILVIWLVTGLVRKVMPDGGF